MPTTADTFSQFSALLRENIQAGVLNLQLRDDDVSQQIVANAEPIYEAGRKTEGTDSGWWAEWTLKLQEPGLVSAGRIRGNTTQFSGSGNYLPIGQAFDGGDYIDPADVPLAAYSRVKLQCRKGVGTVVVNKNQIETNMAMMPLEDITNDYIAAQTRHVRRYYTEQFWGDGSGHIALVNNASGVNVTESTPIEVAVDTGSPFLFVRGQRYVAGSYVAPASYGSSARTARLGTTTATYFPTKLAGVMVCQGVKKDGTAVYLQAVPGHGTIALSDNDVLMREGLYDFSAANVTAGSHGMNGLHNLLVESGNFPGTSLDVTYYTELQALIEGDYASMVEPTPELIANVLDKIEVATGESPMVLVTEPAIKTLYAQMQKAQNVMFFAPSGQAILTNGGVREPVFSHGEKTFVWLTSRMCRRNTLYALEPSKLVRFMPVANGSIQWDIGTGVLAGFQGMFRPISEGRVLTGSAEAPYHWYGQYGLKDPRAFFIYEGIKAPRDL